MKVAVVFLALLVSTSANYTNFIEHQLQVLKTTYTSNLEQSASRCYTGLDFKAQVLQLINHVADEYLRGCVSVILYEKKFELETEGLNFDLQRLLIDFPFGFINAQIARNLSAGNMFTPRENRCRNYILLLSEVETAVKIIGSQPENKVVLVTTSTRWSVEEFLESGAGASIVNLLVISNSGASEFLIHQEEISTKPRDINLYTHELYTDPSGSSKAKLLTAWRCGTLTRNINLFPVKVTEFNGRQFQVVASEQPPFTIKHNKKLNVEENQSQLWDGLEIRILRLLERFLNFTLEIKEARETTTIRGSTDAVIEELELGTAEIGVAGAYTTQEHLSRVTISSPHSVDCAAFITRGSTALPRYRAIFGPFHWSVWIAIISAYMLAILPITYSNNLSLAVLWKNPWHFETMFWYVFGTFTNLFTFTGEHSWSKTKATSTRLLIGWYWCFSIILTACYTGSIVSFITLFIFPEMVEGVDQLVRGNYRIGSLSTGGWGTWFNDSEHAPTKWLLRDIELVPNTTQGLKNVTKSIFLPMFRPYAFLAGRAEMEFIVQANYTMEKKKDILHITSDCFVPFAVGFMYPKDAVYAPKLNEYLLRILQSGLSIKLMNEVKWQFQRSSAGRLLQAGSGGSMRDVVAAERKLTLDDTQGMYLLMGAGYLIALMILLVECMSRTKKTWTSLRLAVEPWAVIVHRVITILRPLGDLKTPEISTYKQYDSRVIHSQREVRRNTEGLLHPRVRDERKSSLPNIYLSEYDPDDITFVEELKDREYPRTPAPVLKNAGSVTSLPWDMGNNSQRVVDDRPFTSFN